MSEAAALILLIGRLIFSIQFFAGAIAHFKAGEQMVGYPRAMGVPLAALGGWPAGVWLLAAAVSVSLGIWPDVGALMIALWGIPTAWFIHAPWKQQDEASKQTQEIIFLRNLAFLGAGIALFAAFVALGGELRYTITEPLFQF